MRATLKNDDKIKKVRYMLNDYPIVKLRIDDINLRILDLKSGEIVKSCGFDEKYSSDVSNTVENYILNSEEKIEDLEIQKSKKEYFLKRIDNAMDVLAEDEKKLVKLRYFTMYNTWKDVAEKMNYEITTCKKKDTKLLEKLSKILIRC